jgi:hypothetical protein
VNTHSHIYRKRWPLSRLNLGKLASLEAARFGEGVADTELADVPWTAHLRKSAAIFGGAAGPLHDAADRRRAEETRRAFSRAAPEGTALLVFGNAAALQIRRRMGGLATKNRDGIFAAALALSAGQTFFAAGRANRRGDRHFFLGVTRRGKQPSEQKTTSNHEAKFHLASRNVRSILLQEKRCELSRQKGLE